MPILTDIEDPSGLISRLAPYPGLDPSDGTWRFNDIIDYYKDQYTIQMRIRYSHDLKRDNRQHVLTVNIADPSAVTSYDLVTTSTDPNDVTKTFDTPLTYMMNYEVTTTAAASRRLVGAKNTIDPHHVLKR